MNATDQTNFVRLQQKAGHFLTKIALGIKFGDIKINKDKDNKLSAANMRDVDGTFLMDLGKLLSHADGDHEFCLTDNIIETVGLIDRDHVKQMIGFHSYDLMEVAEHLLDGVTIEDAMRMVKAHKEGYLEAHQN